MPNLRGVTAGASIVGVGYAIWLLGDWGGDSVIQMLDDIGLIFFAAFATVCAVLAASWTHGKDRAAWVSLAVGAGGWTVGETLWSYDDLVAGVDPFPSWADAGFVTFSVGAALCVGFLLLSHPPAIQLRLVLDGFIVGAAVFGAAWVTMLDSVYSARATSTPALALALSYPLVDIALVTVAGLMLVRAPAGTRPVLAALTAGLMLICLSDMAFAYFAAVGEVTAHHNIAIGWAWGFLCLGIAALVTARSPREAVRPADHHTRAVWLPYVPFAVSAVICTPVLIGGLGPLYVAAAVTVVAVMVRQVLFVADNRRLRGKVEDQALRDPLTGLANRALFSERLTHVMALHQRHPIPVAVLMMDLDGFKGVNEDFGHTAGDAVLARVAERLAGTARSTDTVARFGADEFAVLMEGDIGAPLALARRVVAAFERPFVIAAQEVTVRPSVGVAVAPAEESDITADELLQQADAALQAAKRSASGAVAVFSPEMDPGEETPVDDDAAGSARLLAELRQAIEGGGLGVVYQPKFDLRTYDVVGLEALVRWPHPSRGMLTPDQFLPIVRRYGLMRSMTALVLELALDDAARWHRAGIAVPVAVNVFAPAVSDPELPRQITDALQRRGLPPEALTIEITEDLLLDDAGRTRLVFNTLRDKGIRVAIDDFGSGYSALWYLREFQVDEVKLDRDFIAPILTHPAAATIVRAVIDLAHSLGITPVAEGVENTETATQLRSYGCEIAQGFLYCQPQPAAVVERILRSQATGPARYDADGARSGEIGSLR